MKGIIFKKQIVYLLFKNDLKAEKKSFMNNFLFINDFREHQNLTLMTLP